MEGLKVNLVAATAVMMLVALSAVQNVAAVDAPAPSPASDASSTFVPAALASFVALAVATLF
uniref:Uncharacterized protein n=1 Tax=Kalanchoe fedtschenkoi TaxID=63787 RepID=A0A7N0ZUR5_KALFE